MSVATAKLQIFSAYLKSLNRLITIKCDLMTT